MGLLAPLSGFLCHVRPDNESLQKIVPGTILSIVNGVIERRRGASWGRRANPITLSGIATSSASAREQALDPVNQIGAAYI